MTPTHDHDVCPGCHAIRFDGEQTHPLIGTRHHGRVIVAVKTPLCPTNGTSHTWVLPVDDGARPHQLDWDYLRSALNIGSLNHESLSSSGETARERDTVLPLGGGGQPPSSGLLVRTGSAQTIP